jgi:DNA-binding LacI/PurR family transcriptional regulator
MRRHGYSVDGLAAACAEELDAASEAARRLLALQEAPTAFVCGSDTYALGARLACAGAGGGPGVEIIGFDDSLAARVASPPISSVRQPLTEVAGRVVDLLIDQLHGPGTPTEGVMLRPELVLRDNSGPGHGC